MSKYSTIEQKAIMWYMAENDCIVQLSVKPSMRFMKRDTQKLIEANLDHIVSSYSSNKKEVDRENARLKSVAKREAERKGPYKETYK